MHDKINRKINNYVMWTTNVTPLNIQRWQLSHITHDTHPNLDNYKHTEYKWDV